MKKSLIDPNKIYKDLFNKEIDTLRECSHHPKIMKAIELLEDEKYYYIISEYILGGNVMKRLKKHGKPYSEVHTFQIVF